MLTSYLISLSQSSSTSWNYLKSSLLTEKFNFAKTRSKPYKSEGISVLVEYSTEVGCYSVLSLASGKALYCLKNVV